MSMVIKYSIFINMIMHENIVMCIDMVYIDLYKLHLNILISLKEEWQIEVDVTSYLFEH
jgi:hypothetical protein